MSSLPILFGDMRPSIRSDFDCLYTPAVTRLLMLQLKKCSKLTSTRVSFVQDDFRTWILQMRDFKNANGTIYVLLFFPCVFPKKGPRMRVLTPTGIWTHSMTGDGKPYTGETRSVCIEGFTGHGSAREWENNWVHIFKENMKNWIYQLRMIIEYPNTGTRHHGTGWIKSVLDGQVPTRPTVKSVNHYNSTNRLIQKLQQEFEDDDNIAVYKYKTRIPKCFTYVVTYLEGLSPCVHSNLLSNSMCKPEIRRTAKVGDIVIGYKGKGLHDSVLKSKEKKEDTSYDLEMLFWYRITHKMPAIQYHTKNFGNGRRPDQNYTKTGQHVLLHEFHRTDVDRKSDLLITPTEETSVLLSTDYMCFAYKDGNGRLRGAPTSVTNVCCSELAVRQGQRGHNIKPNGGFKTLHEATSTFSSLHGLKPYYSKYMERLTEGLQNQIEESESRKEFDKYYNNKSELNTFSPATFYILPTEAALRKRGEYQLFKKRCMKLYNKLTPLQKKSILHYWYKLMEVDAQPYQIESEYAAFFNVLLSIDNGKLSWRQQFHSLRTIDDVIDMAHRNIRHEEYTKKEKKPSILKTFKKNEKFGVNKSFKLTNTKQFYSDPDTLQRQRKKTKLKEQNATKKNINNYLNKIASNNLTTHLYLKKLDNLPPNSINIPHLKKIYKSFATSKSNIKHLMHKWDVSVSESDEKLTTFLQIEKKWY